MSVMSYPCGDCGKMIISVFDTRRRFCPRCIHERKLECKRRLDRERRRARVEVWQG